MAAYRFGPVFLSEIEDLTDEFSLKYFVLSISPYGSSLFESERIYCLALLFFWDEIKSAHIQFRDIVSACRHAENGIIRLPEYSYQWIEQSGGEAEKVVGLFLQLLALKYRKDLSDETSDKEIIHGIMYYFDDILAIFKGNFIDGRSHPYFHNEESNINPFLIDPVFQELISSYTTLDTATRYVEELEKKLSEYQKRFGVLE